MANFLGPYYVEINSHSVYAPHVQTIPTLAWNPGLTYGEFETWDGVGKAADDMVEELVDLQAEFFPASYVWDNFVIYHQPTPADPAIPLIGKVLTQTGTGPLSGTQKAVQATWSFKTVAGGLFKLTNLDVYASVDFQKTTPGNIGVEAQAVVAHVTSQGNGWSGRDNSRPSFFLQIAYTLNEKLRRQYFMD